jgi:hypothetical protein
MVAMHHPVGVAFDLELGIKGGHNERGEKEGSRPQLYAVEDKVTGC